MEDKIEEFVWYDFNGNPYVVWGFVWYGFNGEREVYIKQERLKENPIREDAYAV